jgi:MFS family permease
MAVTSYIKQNTGSTALASMITMTSLIAKLLSGLSVPLLADTYKSIHIMRSVQVMQTGMLVGLYVLLTQEFTATVLTMCLIIIGIISFFNGFFSIFKTPVVCSLVSKHQRMQANSILSTIDQTFLFAGWSLGGFILSLTGVTQSLFITAVLLLISFVCLLFIKEANAYKQTQKRSAAKLMEGWHFLWIHKRIRALVVMDIIESLVGTIWIGAITLTFVKEVLEKGEAWWGYINGAYYFGSIVGGIIVYRMSSVIKGRLLLFMFAGSIGYAVFTGFYGLVTNSYLALVLLIMMGPAYQLRDVAQETIYQNTCSNGMLPKVIAAKSTLVQAVFILSTAFVGTVADLLGVRFVYLFSSFILLLTALIGTVALVYNKYSIEIDKTLAEWKENI